MAMVLGQPGDVVLHGVETGRRQDARLAHPATEHFPIVTRRVNRGLVARQHAADRRTQALGQAHGYRIDALRIGLCGQACRRAGVEQPGAVHVDAQVV